MVLEEEYEESQFPNNKLLMLFSDLLLNLHNKIICTA